ncbi:hypothetical protein J2TS4_21210 [Paenibacillus sp. J2TS4]|nr:hypothetical protein J2TS4_21210 [Paenibacillus sp. J2TS4]
MSLAHIAYEGSSEIQVAGMPVAGKSFFQPVDAAERRESSMAGLENNPANPIAIIESLKKARKTVRIDNKTGNSLTLIIEADAGQWTQLTNLQWQKQLEELREEQKIRSSQYVQTLGADKAARLEQEVNERIHREKVRLDQLGATLSADGQCRILLELPNKKAKEMEVETRLSYTEAGENQQEIVRSGYIFH